MDSWAAAAAGVADSRLPAVLVGLLPLEQAVAVSRISVAVTARTASCVRVPVNRPYRSRAGPFLLRTSDLLRSTLIPRPRPGDSRRDRVILITPRHHATPG